jgi:hypothetical protein
MVSLVWSRLLLVVYNLQVVRRAFKVKRSGRTRYNTQRELHPGPGAQP